MRFTWIAALFLVLSCASTDIIESPKTAYVAENKEKKDPDVIWTSRTMTQKYEYLGRIKSRSWTYNGALQRLIEGGAELRADAIVDIHYEQIGFLSSMEAFAVKYSD